MMESLKPPSIQRSYSDVDKFRTNDLDDNNKRSISDSHINNDRKRSMSDVSLAVKDIINDTWELKKKVGKGSFCELFVAKNILPPTLLSSSTSSSSSSSSSTTSITTTTSLLSTSLQYCAIKINNDDTSVLRAEGDILHNLCNINNIPSYITHGKHEGRDYIVMELLSGDDMSKVRDRIRLSSPTGLIPLNIATYFAHQMFLAVEAIHKRGYIHRDIKPANFVQRNNNSSDFCVVDFGMAKQFRDKDGTIKPKREKAEFRGTTVYASPNASMGDDQCPRDDLYSIIFVLLDLLCGKLPWSEASRSKDKPKVIALKQEYVSNDPKVLIDWVVNTIKVIEDKKKVSTINNDNNNDDNDDNDDNNTTTSIECLNFPKCAQDSVLEILKELRSLEYESIPDYHKIETAILGMIPTGTIENVRDINYKCEGFEWRAGFDKLKGIDEISYDTNQQQKVLCAKGRVLRKIIQKQKQQNFLSVDANSQEENTVTSSTSSIISCNNNNSNNIGGEVWLDLTYAKQWQLLVTELLTIEKNNINKESVEILDKILRESDRFFLIDLGASNNDNDSDEYYNDFHRIQKTIYELSKFHNAMMKRPRDSLQSLSSSKKSKV